ncbi:jg20904 [Pararge aegeria aegeria]|uniref:Jg20904 protein n=1 Tax=Pararge aegeria aegeria TaxID=348720 RepID=A0A8S4RKZ5_9NEOP|nr:jg20904 [Pararge aegeria aegeria]
MPNSKTRKEKDLKRFRFLDIRIYACRYPPSRASAKARHEKSPRAHDIVGEVGDVDPRVPPARVLGSVRR